MVFKKFGACWNFDEYLTFIEVKFSHNNRKKLGMLFLHFHFKVVHYKLL